MMKKFFSFLILFCAFFSLVSLRKDPVAIPEARPTIKTVVIDPGHGGKDPGAAGLFSTEAQVSLSVALKLGKAMQKEFPDIKFVYTRTTDVLPGNAPSKDLALKVRAKMANDAQGDLFISIHCNSAGVRAGGWYAKRISGYRTRVVYIGKGKRRKKKTISEPQYESYYVENRAAGTETYIWAADRSDEKSSFVPADESGEDVTDSLNVLDLNSPEAKIRSQLYTKLYFKNSYTLAKYIEEAFGAAGRLSHGGVKQRNDKGIWVLQATGMPSVLVETGFISNKKEEEYLNSEDGQNEIVDNILDAFKRYKRDVESSSKPASQVMANLPSDPALKK